MKAKWIEFYQKHEVLLRQLMFVALSFCFMIIYLHHGEPIIKNNVDGDFHFSRVSGLENIFQSPTNLKYFNHNGTFTSLFYPWLTIYPMYVFTALTDNVLWGYYLYFALMTYVTLAVTYYAAKSITKQTNVAWLTTVIYTFSLTRGLNIYCRIALGEAIAMTFLPLVILGVYRIFYEDKPHWLTLAFGMTLLAYTHMISLVIGCTIVFFFLIFRGIQRKWTVQRLIALFKAGFASVLMSSFTIFPMLEQFIRTKIAPPLMYDLMEAASPVAEIFRNSLANNFSLADSLGIAIFAMMMVLLVKWPLVKEHPFVRDLTIAGFVFLWMSTNLFPWPIFQKVFSVMQFPWRFIMVTTITFALAGAYIVINMTPQAKQSVVMITLIILTVGIHMGVTINERYAYGYDDQITNENIQKNITGKGTKYFNGSGDYAPAKVGYDYDNTIHQRIYIDDEWKKYPYTYTASTKTYTVNYHGDAKMAILPSYALPGEVIEYNGNEISQKISANGLTKVPVKDGKNVYTIRYEYTPIAKASAAVAVVSFIFCAGLGLIQYRRRA